MQQADRPLHARHGRRHQRGQADDLRPVALRRLDDALRRDVAAQIDHPPAVVLQHGPHDVFADVMNVPLHGRQQDRPLSLAFPTGGHRPAHLVKRRARCRRRIHQLRQEDLLSLIARADLIKRRNQVLLHQLKRLHRLEHPPRDARGLVA